MSNIEMMAPGTGMLTIEPLSFAPVMRPENQRAFGYRRHEVNVADMIKDCARL